MTDAATVEDALRIRNALLIQAGEDPESPMGRIKPMVQNISPPTVCVVGPPGVGKSTLISRLSRAFLPVMQGDQGTTTIPIHIESTNIGNYHVQVQCIDIQDWVDLREEIRTNEERTEDQIEILRAIYGTEPHDYFINDPPDLCQLVEREFQTHEEVYDFLLSYAAREHYLRGRRPRVLYWPVVKKVTIRGNFLGSGIPHGVSIVDLPGFEQAGPRQRIVDGYLVDATTIWFLCRRDAFAANNIVRDMVRTLFQNNIRGDQNPRVIITNVDPDNFDDWEQEGQTILGHLQIPHTTPITPLTFHRREVIPESQNSFDQLVESLRTTGESFLIRMNNLVNMIRGQFQHAAAIDDAINRSINIQFHGNLVNNIGTLYDNRQLGQVPRNNGITTRVNVPQDIWRQYINVCNPNKFNELPLVQVAYLIPGVNVERYIRQVLFDYPYDRLRSYWCLTLNTLYNEANLRPSACVIEAAEMTIQYCVADFPEFWKERLEGLRAGIEILRQYDDIEPLLRK